MTERQIFVRHLIDNVWRMPWETFLDGFELRRGLSFHIFLRNIEVDGRNELCLKVINHSPDYEYDPKVIPVSEMQEIAELYSLVDCAVNHRDMTDEPFFANLNKRMDN